MDFDDFIITEEEVTDDYYEIPYDYVIFQRTILITTPVYILDDNNEDNT